MALSKAGGIWAKSTRFQLYVQTREAPLWGLLAQILDTGHEKGNLSPLGFPAVDMHFHLASLRTISQSGFLKKGVKPLELNIFSEQNLAPNNNFN